MEFNSREWDAKQRQERLKRLESDYIPTTDPRFHHRSSDRNSDALVAATKVAVVIIIGFLIYHLGHYAFSFETMGFIDADTVQIHQQAARLR